MKKILILLVGLMSIADLSLAKDFSADQLKLRLDVFKLLKSEGHNPSIDKDGDIHFEYQKHNYYVIVSSDWSDPFLLTIYSQYGYSDGFSLEQAKNCISAVAKRKMVKLYCMENSYTYRTDLFLKDIALFTASYKSVLDEMEAANEDLRSLVNLGLADMDFMGDKDATFEKAKAYYYADRYDYSFPIFRMLTDEKYVDAYGFMGLAYELGEGVEKDEELMIKYYKMAVENGSPWCAYRLGSYYLKKHSYSAAIEQLEICGSNPNEFQEDALYLIGRMYEDGDGVSKSRSQAVDYYRKSVACSRIMECDARLALIRLNEVVEPKKDFVPASKSMIAGLTPAEMYGNGVALECGLRGYVSLTDAFAYYKASADAGYLPSLKRMGEIYRSEFYPFNDPEMSDKYYQKLLKKYKQKEDNDDEACCEIGYLYLNGYGVEKNVSMAKQYFQKSSRLGNMDACWRLGLILKDESDYKEAFLCFLNSAEKGQGMAMYELARLYEEGLGTSMNKSKAREWYEKCANSDCWARKDAKKALERLGVQDDDGKY